MDILLGRFKDAYKQRNGTKVAKHLTPPVNPGYPDWLHQLAATPRVEDVIRHSLNDKSLGLQKDEKQAWLAVFLAFHRVCNALAQEALWSVVFTLWKEFVSALSQGYSRDTFDAWTVPSIYVACKYLRLYAGNADSSARQRGQLQDDNAQTFSEDITETFQENAHMEDAARTTNGLFSLCARDGNPLDNSRKWALYSIASSMFKIYYRIDSMGLAKNILNSLRAITTDLPDLSLFPKSHQVNFNYYVGMVHFLDEDYEKSYSYFSKAYAASPRSYAKHRALIMTYLVPCRMILHNKLPSPALINQYPTLQRLFGGVVRAIKTGSLAKFDHALEQNRGELVRRRIYLTLERTRDLCMRNCFRKVFLAAGFETSKEGAPPARRTRLKVEEFWAGLRLSCSEQEAKALDRDEVECLLAHCIFRGLIKGYISRQHCMVVLSKGGVAFPGTGV